jgi:hypothetical protein
MRVTYRALLAALAFGAGATPLLAADLSAPSYPTSFGPPDAPVAQSPFFLSEVRLGTFAHDPESPESGSVDINGEILFVKPFSMPGSFWDFLLPRPSIGATINTVGNTSQVYAGLTWTYDITHSIFVEGSFGGSANNGSTGSTVPVDRSELGCNVMFRESGSIGYRFTDHWSIMGTIEHTSNAGLCKYNRGLTNYGARIGYTF